MSITHPELVAALMKPGVDILVTLTPEKVDMLHNGVGISGEAGELLDGIKKHVVYNKPLDRENIVEELGDLEFYMEGLRQTVGITREETLVANIAKLQVRYGAKYSDAAAHARADKLPTEPVGTITPSVYTEADMLPPTMTHGVRVIFQEHRYDADARCNTWRATGKAKISDFAEGDHVGTKARNGQVGMVIAVRASSDVSAYLIVRFEDGAEVPVFDSGITWREPRLTYARPSVEHQQV